MVDKSEIPSLLEDQAILNEVMETLDNLVAAVDILVDNVPRTDSIEDALLKFDDVLLEEGNPSFSDVHMIPCNCQIPVNLPGRDDETMELNEGDAEIEDPFFYEMTDGFLEQDLQQQIDVWALENLPGMDDKTMELIEEDEIECDPYYYEMRDGSVEQDLQQQAPSVSVDDVVRDLLALPPASEPIPAFAEENDNGAVIVVDDVSEDEEVGDGEVTEGIQFIERMMLYFREADLFTEEENQGSGDHPVDEW